MNKLLKISHLLLAILLASFLFSCKSSFDPTEYVVTTMGSGAAGGIVPVAAVPFGMVQLAPDTFMGGTGYWYGHKTIHGFSHTHKSGSGGGSDFLDILFTPVSGSRWSGAESIPAEVVASFSHENEESHPGYYCVYLSQEDIKAELTSTKRCGLHKYTFCPDSVQNVIINLKYGNANNCTIIPEDQYDTVKFSSIEKVDDYSVRGCRISNGWCPEMHVYFFARFSKPIKEFRIYDNCHYVPGTVRMDGNDLRAILSFSGDAGNSLEAYVGISAVDMEGAENNLNEEVGRRSFDKVCRESRNQWKDQLATLTIDDPQSEKGKTLYSCWYNTHLYPMLYNDCDGRFRSSDKKVHSADFDYYAGVLGLWDIFRAHLPLIAVIRPEIANDLMKTFLEHYRNAGQLPIWTLAGQETNCMEGYHSAPVVADFFSKGIRDFDAETMLEALDVSASRDTFGFFCRNYRGAANYLKYHYVPCDKEISACSKTLEYCYDDWCISRFADMLGNDEIRDRYAERSSWYKNIYDPSVALMRGRLSDGSWRTPFDPVYSNHNRPGDDFMEGTAYHYTFHVPQDPDGLAELLGGRDRAIEKLDSLFFIILSDIHGDNPSHDMTGMIGHYAHGNEPGHHIIYFYEIFGQPWKTQQLATRIVNELYNTSPEGICGNDDTGQMSAWYVWNSMGLYPMTHGDAKYMFGAPQHKHLELRHPGGKLTVEAPNLSQENCIVGSVKLNGKPYDKYWISHNDIFKGNVTLSFEMTSMK